jgi:hypothetical protein
MNATKNTTITQINDVRNTNDFKTISFSEYKKTEVKKQLLLNIFNGKVEPACYWCSELVCAGHYTDIWDILLLFLGKHIHLGNPKLPIYLDKRFTIFRNIMQQGLFYDELQLRNNEIIRNMFAEIICIVASSPKKNALDPIKINRKEDFDMTSIHERLKAPSVQFAEPIFMEKDPKELWIAINEFAYHLSSKDDHIPNYMSASYWIEWVFEFDTICKSKKQKCQGDRRSSLSVEPKYQKELVWILWDALIYTAKQRDNEFILKTIESLQRLFCIKFTPATPKKRRYLLYYAVSLLTEPLITNIEMIADKTILVTVIQKIDTIYKQIKQNEKTPNLDYMFTGLKNNLDKSIYKLEMMGSLDPVLARSIDEL